MLDPEPLTSSADLLLGPGALMTGVSLLAAIPLELQRHSEILAEVERHKRGRLRSQAQRDRAALAAGKPLRGPGRPRKIVINGAASPAR